MGNGPHWAQIVQWLTTSVLAVVAAGFAWRQHELGKAQHRLADAQLALNKQKLMFDLFERRMSLFSATQSFYHELSMTNTPGDEFIKWFMILREGTYLFPSHASAKLDHLLELSTDLLLVRGRLDVERPQEEVVSLKRKEDTLKDKIFAMRQGVEAALEPYLRVGSS